MRQIGTIETEGQARVFRAYLLSLGIHADVSQSRDKQWEVWVHEEDRLDEGREELARFVDDPKNPRYLVAASAGQKLEREEQKQNREFVRKQVDVRTNWHLNRMGGAGLTMGLILVSVAVYVFQQVPVWSGVMEQWLSIMSLHRSEGLIYFSKIPLNEVRHGQLWRLVTPIFLHFTILHILFNMMWLKVLGGAVETVEGRWRLLMHVLLYAVAGNVLQLFLSGPSFGGMSGVNYGLFAYVWLVGKTTGDNRYYIDSVNITLMLGFFVACLVGFIPGVANGAHAGGLVLGTLLAIIHLRRIPFTKIRF